MLLFSDSTSAGVLDFTSALISGPISGEYRDVAAAIFQFGGVTNEETDSVVCDTRADFVEISKYVVNGGSYEGKGCSQLPKGIYAEAVSCGEFGDELLNICEFDFYNFGNEKKTGWTHLSAVHPASSVDVRDRHPLKADSSFICHQTKYHTDTFNSTKTENDSNRDEYIESLSKLIYLDYDDNSKRMTFASGDALVNRFMRGGVSMGYNNPIIVRNDNTLTDDFSEATHFFASTDNFYWISRISGSKILGGFEIEILHHASSFGAYADDVLAKTHLVRAVCTPNEAVLSRWRDE